MRELLSPKQLAEAIGVSESSVKRWADEGVLKAAVTAGGHRRIRLCDAVRFIRESGHPVVQPHLLGLGELTAPGTKPGDVHASVYAAVLSGQVDVVQGAVNSMYLAGQNVAALCDGPLKEAMHNVGELWKQGPEGIFVEHRAVDVCTQALNQLRALFPTLAKNPPVAIGGAIEGDPYSLPTLMASCVLGAAGWRTVNVGPNAPIGALSAAVKEQTPSLVWISSSVEEVSRRYERDLRKFGASLMKQGIQIVVGGRGWRNVRFDAESGLTLLGSMTEMAAFAEGSRAARIE